MSDEKSVRDTSDACPSVEFEGGEHTRLCASVAATRRRAARNASKACDVCHGHRKVQHDGDDHECPECAGTGTEDPAWRASLSSSLDRLNQAHELLARCHAILENDPSLEKLPGQIAEFLWGTPFTSPAPKEKP